MFSSVMSVSFYLGIETPNIQRCYREACINSCHFVAAVVFSWISFGSMSNKYCCFTIAPWLCLYFYLDLRIPFIILAKDTFVVIDSFNLV